MKKNKMMRIASVLLIVTILSTCAISGTFAKYVTAGDGDTSARAAKWGINIAITGNDLYASEYDYTDPSVVHGARTWDKAVKATVPVVAPGTSSEEIDGNFSAHISGTPEVAVKYALKLSGIKDIVLTEGMVIEDYTKLGEYDPVTEEFSGYDTYTIPNGVYYAPVKFSLVFQGSIAGSGYQEITLFEGISLTDAESVLDGDLSDLLNNLTYNGVTAYVEDGYICFDCPAGKSIDGDFIASWAWDFDDNGAGTYDVLDTYIGNNAEDFPLEFTFEASATQID